MSREKLAKEYHKKGYNCAQSVIAACGDITGLDEKTAFSVSCGFGGGLRTGEVCGAVCGAVMAVGTAFPFNNADDEDAKALSTKLSKLVQSKFRERHKKIVCRELLAMTAPERHCGQYIESAVQIVGEIYEEMKSEKA